MTFVALRQDVPYALTSMATDAQQHLLTAPPRFVRDVDALSGTSGAQLVRSMVEQATAAMSKAMGGALDLAQLVLGCQRPEPSVVPWLHLHSLYPRDAVAASSQFQPPTLVEPAQILGLYLLSVWPRRRPRPWLCVCVRGCRRVLQRRMSPVPPSSRRLLRLRVR